MDQRHGAGYASATSGLTTATCPGLQDCHEHYNKGTARRVAGSGMVTQIACSFFPATLFDLDLGTLAHSQLHRVGAFLGAR